MENVLIGPFGLLRILLHLAFWFVSSTCWALLVSVFQLGSVNEKPQWEIWAQGEEAGVCSLYSLLVQLLGPAESIKWRTLLLSRSFSLLTLLPSFRNCIHSWSFTNSLGLATARLLWLVMGYCTIPMLPLCSTHSENVTLPLSATTLTNTTQTRTILTQYKHKQTHS